MALHCCRQLAHLPLAAIAMQYPSFGIHNEVEDAALATEVQDMLLHDFAHSVEIDYTIWLRRSVLQRLKEWLWEKSMAG